MQIQLNRAADNAYHMLRSVGGTVYVVGGAVRDTIMGVPPKDIDLLVTGVSASIIENLPGFYLTGEHFGVFRYRDYRDGSEVEVALPRTETSTGPGHKDFHVMVNPFVKLEYDLARRDFTVNSMAYQIDTGELIDPYGGAWDCEWGWITTINERAFEDDPLRVLRAFVLISRYGMMPRVKTASDLVANADRLSELPAERIQAELDKLFAGKYVKLAIDFMQTHGVLQWIFPELAADWDYDQNNPHHQRILGRHQLETLGHVAEISDDIDLRLAALMHDIGKPQSAWVDPVTGSNHFYKKRFNANDILPEKFPGSRIEWIHNNVTGYLGPLFDVGQDHEYVGSLMLDYRLNVLKYPKDRIARMVAIVRGHMWTPFSSERGARRFLNKYGEALAYDLLNHRYGDQAGKSEYPVGNFNLDEQRELLDLVTSEQQPTKTADLAINGHDLIAAGILEPGPAMGDVLAYLTNEVIDDPDLNNRDDLYGMAATWVANWDAQ